MKKQIILFASILSYHFSFGQSDAIIENKQSVTSNDLQSVLYFEGISYEKFNVKSSVLKGKNYQIIIKEFKDGKNIKNDTVFNSQEDEYFRIKEDSLPFIVLTKMSNNNEFKMEFQFNGFRSSRQYKVLPNERDKFTLKSFFGSKSELPVDLNGKIIF